MEAFFYMGGYAFYVWGAFLIVTSILLLNVILPWRKHRQILSAVRQFSLRKVSDR